MLVHIFIIIALLEEIVKIVLETSPARAAEIEVFYVGTPCVVDVLEFKD